MYAHLIFNNACLVLLVFDKNQRKNKNKWKYKILKKEGKNVITTDPIADMLTRIRNANSQKFKTVDVPSSKMKKAIAERIERINK